ncbi:MAG: hypothetical protein WA728_32635, partial [Xanthobacteraceae bacterium]
WSLSEGLAFVDWSPESLEDVVSTVAARLFMINALHRCQKYSVGSLRAKLNSSSYLAPLM